MRKIRRRRRKLIRTIRGGGRGSGRVSRPYVNKRNRLILSEGKRIKKQRGGFIAPIAAALAPATIELVSKLFR